MKTIHKAVGIIIKDHKLLVEKSYGKTFYIAPGGKIQGTETKEHALIRELHEELTITVTHVDFSYYGQFEAPAASDPEMRVVMTVFLVHNWQGKIKASSEVEKLAWVTSDNPDNLPIGSIFKHEIIPELKRKNLIH